MQMTKSKNEIDPDDIFVQKEEDTIIITAKQPIVFIKQPEKWNAFIHAGKEQWTISDEPVQIVQPGQRLVIQRKR